jgi:signal transduction histidine kinase/DNA-binding response OmpR family regulator
VPDRGFKNGAAENRREKENMQKKILIVDDEPDIVKIIKIILEIEPGQYEVHTSSDGRDALKKISEFRPDLILLDEMLPLLKGNEVAKIIKNDPELRKIPVIMVTARHLQKDKVDSLENAMVDDYITKPFEPEELRARIKAMLRIKTLTDELEAANRSMQELYSRAADTAAMRKRMLDEVLRGMPFAVMLTDGEMQILEANSNLYEMLSIDQGRIIGADASALFGTRIKRDVTPTMVQFFAPKKGKLYLEISCVEMDDGLRCILVVNDRTRERLMNNIQVLFRHTLNESTGNTNTEFFKKLLGEVKSYFYAEAGAVYIFDGDNIYKGAMAEQGGAEKFSDAELKVYMPQVKKAMHQRPAYISGADIKKYMEDPSGHVTNIVAIPLKGMEIKLGILMLYNSPGIETSFEYKIEIIDFIVSIVSVLYKNMMLVGKLNKENILVRSLINISQIINSTMEYNKLIGIFVEIVSQFIGSETVGLFLFNKKTHNLEHIHSRGYSRERMELYSKSLISRDEIENYGRDEAAALVNNEKFAPFNTPGLTKVFPLKLRYKLIGYVSVEKAETDPMHMEMLALLMEHVAKSIENSYLFDQILKQNEQLINTTEMLRKTEQRLIISEQLAGMGKFAAAVAHEIRNPLTIMLGAVQNSRNATVEEKDSILEHLEGKIIDIDHILKQMMEYAKQMKITIEEFDPVASIGETLNFIGHKAKVENVRIKQDLKVASKVKADRMWFERVLLNLYMNAMDEMKGGGELTVSASEDAENIILNIGDTGSGIPEEIKNKIFEPFNTSKKTGTGLGLYNVKKAIELQGGKIDFITSKQGTVFTIHLAKCVPE